MVRYYYPFHTEATAFSVCSAILTFLGIVLCFLAVYTKSWLFTAFAVADLLMAFYDSKFSHSLKNVHIRLIDGVFTYNDRNEVQTHSKSTGELSNLYIAKGLKNNTFLILSPSFITPEIQKSIAVCASAKRRLLIDECIAVRIDQSPVSSEFITMVLASYPQNVTSKVQQEYHISLT